MKTRFIMDTNTLENWANGEPVKFRCAEADEENALDMRVVEDRGNRVLVVTLIPGFEFPPQNVFSKSDLIMENMQFQIEWFDDRRIDWRGYEEFTCELCGKPNTTDFPHLECCDKENL